MRGIWQKIKTTMFTAYRPFMLAYSFLSAVILLLVIWGIDAAASTPLFSTGNAAAASGNFRYFFLSWHGYVLVIASCVILILAAAAMLNGALILLEDIRSGKYNNRYCVPGTNSGCGVKESVNTGKWLFGLFARGFLSIRFFLNRENVMLVIQFALFIPLAAVAVFFIVPDPFEIPGLIRYLIQKKLLYEIIYGFLLAALTAVQLRNLFVIQEIISLNIDKRSSALPDAAVIRDTLQGAGALCDGIPDKMDPTEQTAGRQIQLYRILRANRKTVSAELIKAGIFTAAVIFAGACVFMYVPYLLQRLRYIMPRMAVRYIVLFGTWNGLLIFGLALLIAPWVFLIPLTELRGKMKAVHDAIPKENTFACESPGTAEESEVLKDCKVPEEFITECKESGKSETFRDCRNSGMKHDSTVSDAYNYRKRKNILAVFTSACLAAAAVMSVVSYINFDTWFPRARNIEAVVHRLGGDLDAENTLEGQEAAIEAGATAAETDIQRTKDGEYIVFHDGTLKRMCGSPERPCDLTLEQIREKSIITPTGEERKIPTLREVLETARGRETLYLELKGVTVDKKMADDVIDMVREMGMLEDCVIISMNYSVISYIYDEHPEIRCGYLSYFTYGSSSQLDGSILLSLSNAVTPAKTTALHRRGKRLYAWTVNTRSQARRMIRLNVDGIISDRYDIIQSVLSHMESRSDCERIMDVLRN